MGIKDTYEKNQVSLGYQNVEKSLLEVRSQVTGAISRTNFGGSGSQELQEAHQVFKKVDRLLYEATRELRDIEDII